MKTRKLGNQGLEVSELGLGCMGMSEFYGNSNDDEAIAMIHHALDLGVNFLDTADMYGPFTNEKLVGRAIKDRLDRVILATKFANVHTADGDWLGISGKPEYVQQACDASLQRLGVDVIDLYYQHRVDLTVPIEETVGVKAIAAEKGVTTGQLALAWLLAQGDYIVPIPGTKRRSYLEENVGATNVTLTAEDLSRINAVAPQGIAAGDRYPAQSMSALNR